MVRKLCVRSLQRGVGSMDYIYGLLIMEDEDSDNESEYNDVYRETSVSEEVYSDQSPGAAGVTPGTEPLPARLPQLHGANVVFAYRWLSKLKINVVVKDAV